MTKIPEHCKNGAERLDDAAIDARMGELASEWSRDGDAIERRTKVADFAAALAAVNRIGELAERENHHPDLAITGWNRVTVRLSTHDADGLTDNDFVLARGVDAILTT